MSYLMSQEMTLLMLMVVLSTTALIPRFLHSAESNTLACLWVQGAAGPVTHDGLDPIRILLLCL